MQVVGELDNLLSPDIASTSHCDWGCTRLHQQQQQQQRQWYQRAVEATMLQQQQSSIDGFEDHRLVVLNVNVCVSFPTWHHSIFAWYSKGSLSYSYPLLASLPINCRISSISSAAQPVRSYSGPWAASQIAWTSSNIGSALLYCFISSLYSNARFH